MPQCLSFPVVSPWTGLWIQLILCLHVQRVSKLENIAASVKDIESLTSPPPPPPSLTSETPHTHSLFASHEIPFHCSSLMYKEVMFTLLHFGRKSESELSDHQKPDRQNPSRMYDQALRDIPMCWSSIYPARTCCGVSVYRRSFDFSKLKSKV